MKINTPPPEPSMDEILASIRHIIASDSLDEKKGKSFPKEDEDILDLTNLLPEEETPAKKPVREEEKKQQKKPAFFQGESLDSLKKDKNAPLSPQSLPPSSAGVESLISSRVISETAQTLNSLNKLVRDHSPLQAQPTNNAKSGQSIEGLVRDLLKPLLKEWLDANLPTLVQWIVSEQVEKIVNQVHTASPNPGQAKQIYPSKHA